MIERIRTKQKIGTHINIHGGKIPATIIDMLYSTAFRIDYEGCIIPEDKRTHICGRKLVTSEELRHPELIMIKPI